MSWKNRIIGYDTKPANQFTANPLNFRRHPVPQREALRGLLGEVGWVGAVLENITTGNLIDGHARIEEALSKDEETPIPFLKVELTEAEEKLVLASFDPISAMATADKETLDLLLKDVATGSEAVEKMLADLAKENGLPTGEPKNAQEARLTLSQRFLVPPFSVLDARQGYWQDRKRAWIALGIQSELGRGGGGGNVDFNGNGHRLTWVAGDRPLSTLDDTSRKILAAQPQSGTSIFDPVLCELVYTWFSPSNGHILDPFAGGSVRGIVAAYLGRKYTGIDLRPEQVNVNETQADEIVPDNPPKWIVGNSLTDMPKEEYDLIFSCPPYYDLEVYSDDPADLSAYKSYKDFLKDYRAIIQESINRLHDDRFACFVVGDIRDKKGMYRNFVSDTVSAFQDVGAMLYNEAVLVTAVGSLPIRVGRQFDSGRKLGKTHQNVLVFIKGDPKRAAQTCGHVEVADFGKEVA